MKYNCMYVCSCHWDVLPYCIHWSLHISDCITWRQGSGIRQVSRTESKLQMAILLYCSTFGPCISWNIYWYVVFCWIMNTFCGSSIMMFSYCDPVRPLAVNTINTAQTRDCTDQSIPDNNNNVSRVYHVFFTTRRVATAKGHGVLTISSLILPIEHVVTRWQYE